VSVPESENCAPLIGRSQEMKAITVDGLPGVEVFCDCARTTRHIWPAELTEADVGNEVPLTCDGCGTTAWVMVIRTEGKSDDNH
jgi:hypothetical protein